MPRASMNKGPWTHRALVFVFTAGLALLVYWLLGFVIDDLGGWPGPSYDEVEERRLDPALVGRAEDLGTQLEDITQRIDDEKVRQQILRDSTSNSQRTMDQLLEIQRLGLQKDVTPSPEEQQALAESQQLFLTNQRRYQGLNETIARLDEQRRALSSEQRDAEAALEEAREPVRAEHASLWRRHLLRMAALKLVVLVPLLILAGVLALRQRGSLYAPVIYACGLALAVRVLVVINEHFPERYFKYILIVVAIAIVLRVLAHLLHTVARPGRDWLLKQYREAYEAFRCPICNYPIRRGPLKYLSWTRRSIRKLPVATVFDETDTPYTCPICATRLYEECESCHAIRAALLPACETCGVERGGDEATERRSDGGG